MARPKKLLKFKVAPHIVEDLGLNLYTTLPRVFVEYIANAYDADSPGVDIKFDAEAIRKAREVLKKTYELELESATDKSLVEPLESRVLPSSIKIVIEDSGHGMSRDDLDKKFLFAGRRRRKVEPLTQGRSPGGRLLMGRKGLGKLAGFGVAKTAEVISKIEKERHATKILLEYDQLLKNANVHEIPIKEAILENGGGIRRSGTRITLSELLYDPLKSREITIESEIAEYFSMIEPSEFEIRMNRQRIPQITRKYAYAWPEPDLPIEEYVIKRQPREGGGEIVFNFRIRFTGKDEALEAKKRGVRVYAHKRLAAAPSLLGADTNMHGFRMTDYLDGIVHADFIDDEPADYISTDRESLRWESPLLSEMYAFLSEQIKEACKNYQKKRDEDAPKVVEADAFTQQELARYDYSGKDKKLALRFASILERACKRSVNDPVYKNTLPQLFKSIGHGTILTAIADLASQRIPDLDKLMHELIKLSKDELEQFAGSVKARLKGITALKKIIEHSDFKAKRNEKKIQRLFEECRWLVDPTYTQFLVAADVSLDTVYAQLAKELGILTPAKVGDKKEPDLVFLIGSDSLRKIVIVELKASNLPLEVEHLNQLEYYMERSSMWLESKGQTGFMIQGHLIGTKAAPDSKSQGAVTLRKRLKDAGPDTLWKVRDYLEVLKDTQAAHQDLIAIQRKFEEDAT